MKTRHEILSFLKIRGPIHAVRTRSELDATLRAGCIDRIVLIDTEQFRIPQDSWLDLVSKSDFFLCLPGLVMPMCHNAVEAMAVGAIPLISYSEWFLPRLQHGVNCIAFSTLDELASRLEEIFQMNMDAIASLRRGTIEYYSRYLCPASFVQSMMGASAQRLSLHILEEDEGVLRDILSRDVVPG